MTDEKKSCRSASGEFICHGKRRAKQLHYPQQGTQYYSATGGCTTNFVSAFTCWRSVSVQKPEGHYLLQLVQGPPSGVPLNEAHGHVTPLCATLHLGCLGGNSFSKNSLWSRNFTLYQGKCLFSLLRLSLIFCLIFSPSVVLYWYFIAQFFVIWSWYVGNWWLTFPSWVIVMQSLMRNNGDSPSFRWFNNSIRYNIY